MSVLCSYVPFCETMLHLQIQLFVISFKLEFTTEEDKQFCILHSRLLCTIWCTVFTQSDAMATIKYIHQFCACGFYSRAVTIREWCLVHSANLYTAWHYKKLTGFFSRMTLGSCTCYFAMYSCGATQLTCSCPVTVIVHACGSGYCNTALLK